MTNNGIVNIHGKDYMTVARRIELAREDKSLEGVVTEVLSHNPIVVRATVKVSGKTFTGISSVNPDTGKQIERQNPYEVAETSAVGRALGFAGYGVLEAIASADDMVRAVNRQPVNVEGEKQGSQRSEDQTLTCVYCGEAAFEREGTSKTGKPYHGIFCTSENKAHTQWL